MWGMVRAARWMAAVGVLGWVTPGAAAASTVEVNTTADLAAPGCSGGACSIRQALAAAGAGDTIHVPGSATRYAVSLGPLTVTRDVTIAGDGPAQTIVDAGATSGIIDVPARGGDPSLSLTLAQLELTGGSARFGAA